MVLSFSDTSLLIRMPSITNQICVLTILGSVHKLCKSLTILEAINQEWSLPSSVCLYSQVHSNCCSVAYQLTNVEMAVARSIFIISNSGFAVVSIFIVDNDSILKQDLGLKCSAWKMIGS